MEEKKRRLGGKLIAILLTILVLNIGAFVYFSQDRSSNDMAGGDEIDEINLPATNSTDSFFNQILSENRIYTKINPEGIQKLFYFLPVEESTSVKIDLSEGNIKEYEIHEIGGQKYYPLILGYEEARLMKEENLFSNIGDPIKGFFGKNVVVIGIMEKTGSVADMMHIIPLNSGELN